MSELIDHNRHRAAGHGDAVSHRECGSASDTGELVTQDKLVAMAAAPRVMTVVRHLVWIALVNGVVELRNARTAALVQTVRPGHSNTVTTVLQQGHGITIWALCSVTTDADEPQVWAGREDGVIEVRHGTTAELRATLRRHSTAVLCLAAFAGLAYSGDRDGLVVQWQVEGCVFLRVLSSAPTAAVGCLFVEGSVLVAGSQDGLVRVWHIGSGERQLVGHFHTPHTKLAVDGGAGVAVTALCRVGQLMWSGDAAGRVVRWRLRSCEAIQLLHPHEAAVRTLRRVGGRVYSSAEDGSVGVFDSVNGTLLHRLLHQPVTHVTCVTCPARLARFVLWSAGADGVVRCWYHDEYVSMSGDYDLLNEATWYAAGSTPYREFAAALAARNARLRRRLAPTEQGVKAVLERYTKALGGKPGLRGYRDELQRQARLAEERRAKVAKELDARMAEVARLDAEIKSTAAQLQGALDDLRALDPTAVDRVVNSLVSTGDAQSPSGATAGPAMSPPRDDPAVTAPTAAATLSGPLVGSVETNAIPAARPPVDPPPSSTADTAYGIGAARAATVLPNTEPPVPATTTPPVTRDGAGSTHAAGGDVPIRTSGDLPSASGPLTSVLTTTLTENVARAADRTWNGVEWTNPNVGNYIQRRYYGAAPSLRAPDLQRRIRHQHRLPRVKVAPLPPRAHSAEATGRE